MHGHAEIVDFQFFCDLDSGIDTSLCDWWLQDSEFFVDCEEFEEWRAVAEDGMIWELIELWETWHDIDCDGTTKPLSAEEKLSYDDEKNKILLKHQEKRAAIEAEAVTIGL
jgi:hypothetical protein